MARQTAKEYLLDRFSDNPMLVYYVTNRMRDEVDMPEAARILSDALQREHPEFMLEEYPNLPSRDECFRQLNEVAGEYIAEPRPAEPHRDTWAEMSSAVESWLANEADAIEPESPRPPVDQEEAESHDNIRSELAEIMREIEGGADTSWTASANRGRE
jgi:hypothetical protein